MTETTETARTDATGRRSLRWLSLALAGLAAGLAGLPFAGAFPMATPAGLAVALAAVGGFLAAESRR